MIKTLTQPALRVKNTSNLLLSLKQQKLLLMTEQQALLSGLQVLDSEAVFTARDSEGQPLFARWRFAISLLDFEGADSTDCLLQNGEFCLVEADFAKGAKWHYNGFGNPGQFAERIELMTDPLSGGGYKDMRVATPPAIPYSALVEAKKNALTLLEKGIKFSHYEVVGESIWEEAPRDPVIVGVVDTYTKWKSRVLLSAFELTPKELEFLC